jgi:hypothetical protein
VFAEHEDNLPSFIRPHNTISIAEHSNCNLTLRVVCTGASVSDYCPLFYFTNLICVYGTRTSRHERTAPHRAPPFQLEGCGPTFKFLNGLRVDSMRENPEWHTCKVRRETSLRDSFYLPLFRHSTCNLLTESRSTCDDIVDQLSTVLHYVPRLLVPTPTPGDPMVPTSTTIRRHLNWSPCAATACRGPSTIFFTTVDAVFHPTHPHLAQRCPYGPRLPPPWSTWPQRSHCHYSC